MESGNWNISRQFVTRLGAFAAAALLWPAIGSAQGTVGISLTPPDLPRWEIAGDAGWLSSNKSEIGPDCVTFVVVIFLAVQPAAAQAAETAELWRAFAEEIDVGSAVNVRLRNGQRFTATLVQARSDALLLQPRTRVPVPVQPVPYESIVSMERVRSGGIGAGKAAAIGVAMGVGAFLATLLIFIAAIDD